MVSDFQVIIILTKTIYYKNIIPIPIEDKKDIMKQYIFFSISIFELYLKQVESYSK